MFENVDIFAKTRIFGKPDEGCGIKLPQDCAADELERRRFQLSLARTDYNYMHTYFDDVPVSADLPRGELYDQAYRERVQEVAIVIAENFKRVIASLIKQQLEDTLPDGAAGEQAREAFGRLRADFNIFNLKQDFRNLSTFMESVEQLFGSLGKIRNLPRDVEKMLAGVEVLRAGFEKEGTTAFLKSTMYELLRAEEDRSYRHAKEQADFDRQYSSIKKPLALTIPRKPWMSEDLLPCLQDWFLGYLQTAGFNTTVLRGVRVERGDATAAALLPELLRKFPVTDLMLQTVTGDPGLTLEAAARQHRLFVCDYSMQDGVRVDRVFDEQRYLGAPIALFYWSDRPRAGFPPVTEAQPGYLMPVAIQIGQRFDAECNPIFTPNDCSGADDPNGLKWRIAKYFVNVANAVHHESIAHLGDCHLTVEPIVVATRRQLAEQHPLFKLLLPHLRFTININNDARHSLIIPGGVVATTVGPAIEDTWRMISEARRAWRWDDNTPDRVFRLRGLQDLPEFAFRDDTVLLWRATEKFVRSYLAFYYRSDADLLVDVELQRWINELASPKLAAFRGMDGLVATGDAAQPWAITSFEYLVKLVSYIVYLGGPQHASVGYAQYPLMSYMPCVAGVIYHPAPQRSTRIESEAELVKWYPPLDIALYTFSFEYLLSEIQYDTFGHYSSSPRDPYFGQPELHEMELALRDELALIEIEIRRRNKHRAVPYEFQLPSQIPNSVCI
jgi:arachidonate 15-lipoxygenase